MQKKAFPVCYLACSLLALGIHSAGAALLTGSIIGTTGSWNNSGNTVAKVFDGSLSTFFDAPDPGNLDWAGLDFGGGASDVITAIAYCPRSGFSGRMIGGIFQGANTADFSDAVNLFALNAAPAEGVMTRQTIALSTPFRYGRYLAPNAGWGNIAELQFFGYGPGVNLALGQPATGSSTLNAGSGVTNAVDGSATTRWASAVSDPQWLYVDLGSTLPIGSVRLNWGAAYAKSFQIQVSPNAAAWSDVYSTSTGAGGTQTISLTTTNARYVRVYGTQQGNSSGYSLAELAVYSSITGPTLTNQPASGVQSTLATLNGQVLSTGGETPAVVLYYGTTDGGSTPANWANRASIGQQTGAFSLVVTGITANTTYYFTASASNSVGVGWAVPSASFQTPAPATLPVITNFPTSNIQASTAVLGGQVVSTGGGGETPAVTIYYGTSNGGTSAAAWANNVYLGPQSGQFNATITGLTTNTQYYFTAAAANSAGMAWASPSLGFTTLSAAAQVSALTWHYDNTRQGANTNETILAPSNVNVGGFGKLFSYTVDGHVYAQPLVMTGVNVPGKGTHNIVFVATQHDSVYAFDADSNAGDNGGLLWHTNLGISSATPNSDYGNRYGPYHDINPEVGITGTPVIYAASGTIYFDVFTHEGTQYLHRLHALDVATGAERSYAPVVVSGSVPGLGVGSSGGVLPFSPIQSLQRPALTLVGGILFVVYTGYADTDPYHGWVFGYEASTLRRLTNFIFNTSPNSTIAAWGANAGECGIWMAGNGLCVDANTNLYFEVGNGPFNANTAGGTEYGDSFVKLSTTNGLAVADYFTPYNQASLASSDSDLGSGGPLLLPDAVGSSTHRHLIVGCGKQGTVYLIDRDNMGRYNTANNNQIVQALSGAVGGTWSSPAYFNGRIYYHGSGDVLKAFTITNAAINPTPVRSGTGFGYPGATPVVSANGNQNGIVWDLQTDAYSSGGPAILRAYAATNVAIELYNSSQNVARDNPGGAVKYTLPTVVNGKVYVGAQFTLTVFGNSGFLATPVIAPNGGVFTNSVTVSISDSTAGAAIYYTVNGTTPTTNSILYTGPFVLTNSAVVQAVAAKPGAVNSGVASAGFLNSSAIGNGAGLLGQYWSNHFPATPFSGTPTFTRTDPTINFDWGNGAPDAAIGADHFTARWTGSILPQFNETYTFYTTTDDGARLFVNGQQIINQWVDQGPTEASGTITLKAQERYNIEMDYYENASGASATLSWSSLSTPKAILPQAQLYPVVNPAPGIVLNSPANGAAYTAAATVTLNATADAQYNSIDRVAFYANGSLLGSVSNNPYALTIAGLGAGNYGLTAVVTDGSGLMGTSAPVNISVASGSGKPYGLAARASVPAFFNMPQTYNGTLPARLSQTGVFLNTAGLIPVAGLIPYAPNAALWSDGALKTRWMAVPYSGGLDTPDEQITFAPTGEWAFPTGTIFVKNFDLVTDETDTNAPRRRLETRLLVRDPNGSVYGVTYKWRPDNSDADLLTDSLSEDISITNTAGIRTQTWYYPSPADCLTCHTPAANYVLGVKTRQLNGNFNYPASGVTDNQLRALNRIGLFNPSFNEADIGGYAQLVSINNQSASLQDRFRSYIDANCAQCHRPGGTGTTFDARYDTALTNQHIINENVLGSLGYDNARVLTPRDIWRSILYQRANATDPLIQMPQLARNLVDTNAMAVIAAWINGLPGTPALPPPNITPDGGTFTGSVSITLQDSDTNATLRYTLDGSLPTTNSTLYAGPFLLQNGSVLKAKAFEAGFIDSVASFALFTLPSPVFFTIGGHFTNSAFQLEVSGQGGQSYVFEATTNFSNWVPLGTNVAPANLFNVLDSNAAKFPARFYRLIQLP